MAPDSFCQRKTKQLVFHACLKFSIFCVALIGALKLTCFEGLPLTQKLRFFRLLKVSREEFRENIVFWLICILHTLYIQSNSLSDLSIFVEKLKALG